MSVFPAAVLPGELAVVVEEVLVIQACLPCLCRVVEGEVPAAGVVPLNVFDGAFLYGYDGFEEVFEAVGHVGCHYRRAVGLLLPHAAAELCRLEHAYVHRQRELLGVAYAEHQRLGVIHSAF